VFFPSDGQLRRKSLLLRRCCIFGCRCVDGADCNVVTELAKGSCQTPRTVLPQFRVAFHTLFDESNPLMQDLPNYAAEPMGNGPNGRLIAQARQQTPEQGAMGSASSRRMSRATSLWPVLNSPRRRSRQGLSTSSKCVSAQWSSAAENGTSRAVCGWIWSWSRSGGSATGRSFCGMRSAASRSEGWNVLLASDIGLWTERRLHQSLCLPAGVPSDHLSTTTKKTDIGGKVFSFGYRSPEMYQ